MKRYKVKEAQNIIDLAIQESGSVEGVFDLITNNDLGNINVRVNFGDEILINSAAPTDINIRDFYAKRQALITTADFEQENQLGDFNNDFNNDFTI